MYKPNDLFFNIVLDYNQSYKGNLSMLSHIKTIGEFQSYSEKELRNIGVPLDFILYCRLLDIELSDTWKDYIRISLKRIKYFFKNKKDIQLNEIIIL
jgi:hypothetical protein